jgi:hypothetical protein
MDCIRTHLTAMAYIKTYFTITIFIRNHSRNISCIKTHSKLWTPLETILDCIINRFTIMDL